MAIGRSGGRCRTARRLPVRGSRRTRAHPEHKPMRITRPHRARLQPAGQSRRQLRTAMTGNAAPTPPPSAPLLALALSHSHDRSHWVCTWRGWCADRRRFEAKVLRGPLAPGGWEPSGKTATAASPAAAGPTVRVLSAHRWVWEHDLGRLPNATLLPHTCNETNCVRLDHLIPGDHPANMADMCARGRQGGPWHRGRAGRARAIRAARRVGASLAAVGWARQCAPRRRCPPGRQRRNAARRPAATVCGGQVVTTDGDARRARCAVRACPAGQARVPPKSLPGE